MKKSIETVIMLLLYGEGGGGLKFSDLLKKLGGSNKKDSKRLKSVLGEMEKTGRIYLRKGAYRLTSPKEVFRGEISKVCRSYGFVVNPKTGEEFFVRGRDLLAGVPGDGVLARTSKEMPRDGNNRNAVILAIISGSERALTGIAVEEGGELRIVPDSFMSDALPVVKCAGACPKPGDKVRFSLNERGKKHGEHTVDVVSVYGNGDKARVSVLAYLDEKNIPAVFSEEVAEEAAGIAKKGISPDEIQGRLDLRGERIFTIDGSDTKDIDDGVSIKKSDRGYTLGVHIADVSYYVKMNSALDKEALHRGNSVYIADMVIPMLPKELSNGICSLNPNEERLAFSCIMELSEQGVLLSSQFKKSVILSRVQGVYSEVNEIIAGTANEAVLAKYAEVKEQIPLMTTLAATLKKNRTNRGALNLMTDESKIICDKNGICIDIKKRETGVAEGLIEEFMLAANNAAAKTAMDNNLPFVYRVHEAPMGDKLETLSEALAFLGVNAAIGRNGKVSELAKVLEAVRDSDKAGIVNTLVLRTMMKARYFQEPLGHYGLVTEEYAHFTSPIRRYSDLAIHRILSDFTLGMNTEKLYKKYGKYSVSSSARASATELTAVSAERDCDKFYMAEYMKEKIDEEYTGIISGVTSNCLFVKLENTVEGRVDVTELPAGVYETEQNLALREKLSGKLYTIGDKITVKCRGVSVAAGLVSFVLV